MNQFNKENKLEAVNEKQFCWITETSVSESCLAHKYGEKVKSIKLFNQS